MQELFPGAFILDGDVGGRPLQLTYLKGDLASLLLDTGCACDPTRFILPQLREAGGNPNSLTWILNSHPDVDHTGGNHEMKQMAPSAILACGDAERALCEDPAVLYNLRYDAYRADHHIFYEGESREWLEAQGGSSQPIEAAFRGGEWLRLGKNWEVEILAVPGHARGHLAIFDPKHQTLFAGDAIHGDLISDIKGNPSFCPTYSQVDDYLGTIQLVEHLPIQTYVGCHWPIKRGPDIARFCRQSRAFVEKVERLVLEMLKQPCSLRDLCLQLGPQLGEWPRTADLDLVYALHGHVERLLSRQAIRWRVRQTAPRVLEYAVQF
jgi:glyoxylase-like metal-dependent hydrolase (beta-lactamase superfamily II)